MTTCRRNFRVGLHFDDVMGTSRYREKGKMHLCHHLSLVSNNGRSYSAVIPASASSYTVTANYNQLRTFKTDKILTFVA